MEETICFVLFYLVFVVYCFGGRSAGSCRSLIGTRANGPKAIAALSLLREQGRAMIDRSGLWRAT
jgi:hypothetical protein